MSRFSQEVIDAEFPSRATRLKTVLIAGDIACVLLGFGLVVLLGDYQVGTGMLNGLVELLAASVVGFWAIRTQGLFLTRVCAVRAVEFARLVRAAFLLAVGMLMLSRLGLFHSRVRGVVYASTWALIFLLQFRSGYRMWMSRGRSQGKYARRMVVIGTDVEAVRIINLFETHRDLGIEVVGVVGDREEALAMGLGGRWLAGLDDAEKIPLAVQASGVVLSTGSLGSDRLNDLVRSLQAEGLHVHLATGIAGIDGRRLRSLPMSYEPLFYVEASHLSRVQLLVKRLFDLVLAAVGLVVLSPLLLVVAILIKLDAPGPVFYVQERVGRRGTTFGVLKFRTMVVDADAKLDALRQANERQGPLFKMTDDPRVTRIGRFLRHSSIDELPQLFNVLRGQMSLVGPRPALPAEVAKFPQALRVRELVAPGITGLWQVEARDNPSFEAYRRLDVFYVENWSITLDVMIVFGTLEQVLVRAVTALLPFLAKTEEAPPAPTTLLPRQHIAEG